MKSPYQLIRICLFFILIPLSLLYGLVALLRRIFVKPQVILQQKVVSVGNIQVGGTGKTPVVLSLCKILDDKAVVVTRNYGASLKRKTPEEVTLDSDVRSCGDEALEIKRLNPKVRVFSGPVKSDTAFFASKKVPQDSVLIIDDGAQHLKLKKDLNIIVWDLSRNFIDFFPLPFGLCREFWFSKINNRIDIFNRKSANSSNLNFFLPNEKDIMNSDYVIREISNLVKNEKNAVLISGIGNFKQLKDQVDSYLKKEDFFTLKSFIAGKDHDDFNWFKPREGDFYLTTEKDYVKLSSKIAKDKIGLIKSDFSPSFYNSLSVRIKTEL